MYEAFYGFAETPFRLTPDPAYLFLSRHHREALAHLLFGIREGPGFVCVTGEIGTGKTTLLRALLRDLEADTLVAYLFNPALSDVELLQTINGELSLPAASCSKKELVDTLNRFLLEQKAAGRRVVVIVDEAQALAPATLEQLRLLSNLETETEKLLQIVLVGQPELRALLARPDLEQLNQRITVRWHLRPLDRDETAAYLRHRLRIAGGSAAVGVFTPAACRMIHRYAGGVPRLVNIAAHHALLAGFTREEATIGTRTMRRALAELGRRDGPRRLRLLRPVAGAAMTALAIGLAFALLQERNGPPGKNGERAPDAAGGGTQKLGATGDGPAAGLGVTPPAAADPAGAFFLGETPAGDPGRLALATGSPAPPVPDDPRSVALAPSDGARAADEDAAAFWTRLAAMDHRAAALAATESLLLAWRVEPLRADERARRQLDLQAIASRRGLGYLPTSGTLARFAQLNLPAILELSVPPAGARRFAMLASLAGGRPRVRLDDAAVTLAPAEIEAAWLGEAHVFWRDFERLPSLLVPGSIGPEVARLHGMLARLGDDPGSPAPVYDEATAEAIARFQRSHRLIPDGIVGPLTKIVLYNVLGGYDHPRLAGDT
jgi:general secretion pathway protein A